MKKIALIGCTGSIGGQVLDVVRRHQDLFAISVLVCGHDRDALRTLSREFHPAISLLSRDVGDTDLFSDCDVAFIASSGFSGLLYTLQAARAGKVIALANKESLVCGGELVLREAERFGATLVPVDSEHSAIFQALSFQRNAKFSKLILTASGGPFRNYSKEQLERVTPKEALHHPTYQMGAKISVDSATLLNKGYEVIEAKWLYGADFSKIDVIIHPESIVHSLVCFEDGAMIAQLAYPDMRLPVQLALTYPERVNCLKPLELDKIANLRFYPFEQEKFPCFCLALQAGKEGGTAPTILNAAAEIAVQAFLEERIPFLKIAETMERTLNKIPRANADSLDCILDADRAARECAKRIIYDN